MINSLSSTSDFYTLFVISICNQLGRFWALRWWLLGINSYQILLTTSVRNTWEKKEEYLFPLILWLKGLRALSIIPNWLARPNQSLKKHHFNQDYPTTLAWQMTYDYHTRLACSGRSVSGVRRKVRRREKIRRGRGREATRPLIPVEMLLVPTSFANEICLPGSD